MNVLGLTVVLGLVYVAVGVGVSRHLAALQVRRHRRRVLDLKRRLEEYERRYSRHHDEAARRRKRWERRARLYAYRALWVGLACWPLVVLAWGGLAVARSTARLSGSLLPEDPDDLPLTKTELAKLERRVGL